MRVRAWVEQVWCGFWLTQANHPWTCDVMYVMLETNVEKIGEPGEELEAI